MRNRYLGARGVLLLGTLAAVPASGGPAQTSDTAVSITAHFAFHSDLPTNLNDALITAGGARIDGDAELFHAAPEAACFDGLAPSLRAGWDRAVDYYAEIVSPARWSDRQQFLLRLDLAGVGQGFDDRERQFADLAASFRAAAAPAYSTCRWPAQDADNRRWIAQVGELLATHESAVAQRLERLYDKPWDGLPIRVDVVETVNAQGANSIYLDPVGGHLLVSPTFEDGAALEVVFHEASHLLMRRNDPVQRALADAAAELDVAVPEDLWHVVLFYTTGETVRRALADAGNPDYEPLLYEIFGRSSWARYREPLESAWRPYLDGERGLLEAATALIRRIIEAAPGRRDGGRDRAPGWRD